MDKLVELAMLGDERVARCDRPVAPPRQVTDGELKALPFPVEEDAESPVRPYPGMTNILRIGIWAPTLDLDVGKLFERAIHAFHPLFEGSAWPGTAVIFVHGSKVAQPDAWVRFLIAELLPVLHAVAPIQSVTFGRVKSRKTC